MADGAKPAAAPIAGAKRLPLLDALRGFAILGVLFSYTLWNLGGPPSETWSRADRIIDDVATILIDTKALSLFGFLFGLGAAQQWRRLEARGVDPRPIYGRRLLFLFAVGLVHGALLRNGDILAPYAILGATLPLMRRASGRTLAAAAIGLALMPSVVHLVLAFNGWTLVDRPGPAGGNLDWLRYWYLTNPLVSWPRILALMLAGMLAERTGLVDRLAADRRFALRLLAGGLLAAAVAHAALSLARSGSPLLRSVLAIPLYHLVAWSLATGYAGAVALICQRPGGVARLRWPIAVGRMAFTNYLLQAVLIVPVSLGFGLFDTITPIRGVGLALAVMAIQVPLSVWWMGRFDQGPLESLWRAVSYGRLFRRQPVAAGDR